MLAGYRDEENVVSRRRRQTGAGRLSTTHFYNRQQAVWKSRTISANDLENARSSRDQAQATPEIAQDKLSQYHTGNRPQDIALCQSQP
ncbi:hypothetical protein KIF59_19050 [Enterobacter cloacae subsp. cloacae]|nr:hypothetical protein [Enterobacter cloacae subsp. cloacae]